MSGQEYVALPVCLSADRSADILRCFPDDTTVSRQSCPGFSADSGELRLLLRFIRCHLFDQHRCILAVNRRAGDCSLLAAADPPSSRKSVLPNVNGCPCDCEIRRDACLGKLSVQVRADCLIQHDDAALCQRQRMGPAILHIQKRPGCFEALRFLIPRRVVQLFPRCCLTQGCVSLSLRCFLSHGCVSLSLRCCQTHGRVSLPLWCCLISGHGCVRRHICITALPHRPVICPHGDMQNAGL